MENIGRIFFFFFFFRLFVVLATRSFLKERWGKECVTFRDKKASLLWNLIKNRKKKKKKKSVMERNAVFSLFLYLEFRVNFREREIREGEEVCLNTEKNCVFNLEKLS